MKHTVKVFKGDEEIASETRDGVLAIELHYPRVAGCAQHVRLGLVDVRAADDLRISYDFGRDGWRIEQAGVFEWDGDDKEQDEDWQEVAFVQAWAREPPEAER